MMNISERDELLQIYSDVHKDAYGFRPGEGQWYAVKAMSLDELKAEMDRLGDIAADEYAREVAAEKSAIVHLQATIARMMSEQGIDEATAYRWLIQAEGDYVDLEHFLWLYGCGCGNDARALQADLDARLGLR